MTTEPQADGNCPLCDGPGCLAFAKLGFLHHTCGRCGTLFVHPVPSAVALALYYSNAEGDQNSRLCWEGSHRHAYPTWRRVLREAAALAGAGPLLDVGCGAGQFLSFARLEGWTDLVGVEVSAEAAAAARHASGAQVHEVAFADAPLPEGRFAAVTLLDVLEHLPDARRTLRRARDVLRPGGVLVVSTPNRAGMTLRVLRSRSALVMPPEHLLLATERGLRMAATAEGFEICWARSMDVHVRDWLRLLGMGGPAKAAQRGGPVRAEAHERDAHRLTYERLTSARSFALLQQCANAVLGLASVGDQLVALARKPPTPA